ncbi:hypothetical protein E3O19_15395 [Cryobacterium algoritolerans]|uniref:Uncharacterized protein n=1 Tax=Cryobacterium algoritolerans TaxID=1259184 RepID=A0A4R8WIX6_9MICO|nr:hypothetical protein [Cryobacterium algoritolerans]TFC10385.1 hypothetical protein E3O19_15395 [Cryobacterium algoritolerans]
MAARRADAAEVIAAAVEAKTVLGWGHRKIAAGCGRPASTVRGWLRAFAVSAGAIGERFTGLLVRDAPDSVVLWPKPAGTARGEALSVNRTPVAPINAAKTTPSTDAIHSHRTLASDIRRIHKPPPHVRRGLIPRHLLSCTFYTLGGILIFPSDE